MNNERYRQIIDEAYEKWIDENSNNRIYPNINGKEEFINRIKTDSGFSERWGLMIEERELCGLERWYLCKNEIDVDDADLYSKLDRLNIPTKLITITYKEEKIEVYD